MSGKPNCIDFFSGSEFLPVATPMAIAVLGGFLFLSGCVSKGDTVIGAAPDKSEGREERDAGRSPAKPNPSATEDDDAPADDDALPGDDDVSDDDAPPSDDDVTDDDAPVGDDDTADDDAPVGDDDMVDDDVADDDVADDDAADDDTTEPEPAAECGRNTDCTAGGPCDRGKCVDGSCEYTPDDTQCGASEVCTATGCCTDGDEDGHGASSCGGDDCNDEDADVHPGAPEACDGVDRNCNDENRAVLGDVVELTTSQVAKRRFAAAYDGDDTLLVAWTAKPTGAAVIQSQRFDTTGAAVDASPTRVDDPNCTECAPYDQAYDAQSVVAGYSPTRNVFALAWTAREGNGFPAAAALVGADGVPGATVSLAAAVPPGLVGDSSNGWRFTAVQSGEFPVAGGSFALPQAAPTNGGNPPSLLRLTDTGSTAESPGYPVTRLISGPVQEGTGFLAFGQFAVHFYTAGGSYVSGTTFDTAGAFSDGNYQAHWDGEAVVTFGLAGTDGLGLERRLLDGTVSFYDVVDTGSGVVPLAILHEPSASGTDANGLTGLLYLRSGELVFAAPHRSGDAAVSSGVIATAPEGERGQLFHDGQSWIAIWDSTSGGVRQISLTRVVCE